jgi:hypothetical protein
LGSLRISNRGIMDRNKKILYALVILLGLSLTYRIFHPFRQQEVAFLKYRDGAQGLTSRKIPGNRVNPSRPPSVKLSLLEKPAERSRDVLRNPFFEEKSVEPVEKVDPASKRGEPEPVRPAPPDPMETVNRELGQMKVFGYYEGRGDTKLFVERGKDILVISEGDKIDGKYLVKEIGKTSVTLRAENIGQDLHIDLSGM